ncbi:ABC transporter, partial [Streptomyces goshikiensis]
MTALLRYQGALLLRSQRWLAPVLLYAAFLAVGFRPGDPVPDSLGYSAAALVPVTAWLVRTCLSVEPDAARDCAAAAAGPVRVHAAALLTGLGWGVGAGGLGAVAVLLLGAGAGPRLPTAALAGAASVL